MMSEHHLYRFFNKEKEIIYIGRTSGGIKYRATQHFTNGHLPPLCYENVARIEYCIFPTQAELKIAEIYLINIYKPVFNTQDKEYKSIEMKIELELEWFNYEFDTVEESENKKLKRQISDHKKKIEKLKEERDEDRKYFNMALNSKDDQINEYKKFFSARDSNTERQITYNDLDVTDKEYVFNSYKIGNIHSCGEFFDIEFVGEITVNAKLVEKITAYKGENEETEFHFTTLNKTFTQTDLDKSVLEYFNEMSSLSFINKSGFKPISVSSDIIHRMIDYIENKKHYQNKSKVDYFVTV